MQLSTLALAHALQVTPAATTEADAPTQPRAEFIDRNKR
jgi:hypothetical protein